MTTAIYFHETPIA